jgi:outer membrane protein TolC
MKAIIKSRTARKQRPKTRLFLPVCLAGGLMFLPSFREELRADEPAPAVNYSLQACIALGLQHSHRLQAGRQQTQAVQARLGETYTGYLPTITGGAGYTRLSETDPLTLTIDTPMGPQTQELAPAITDAYTFNLSFKQPLFTGFRLLNNTRRAIQAWQASREDYARTEQQFITDIKKSYWQVIRATEALQVSTESLQVVDTYLQDITSHFNQGVATANEVLKARAQLARTRLQHTEAEQSLQLATGQLAFCMGLDVQTPLAVSIEPFQTLRAPAPWKEVLNTALQNRPELKVMNRQIRMAELDLTQAQAAWYPVISLNGNFTYAQPNTRIFPAREQFDFTWELGVSAGFDMGSWFAIPFKTAQAKARLTELRENALQVQNSITLEVMRSHLALNKMSLQLSAAEATLTQALENRKDVATRYATGLALKTEQLEAELERLKADLALRQARIDYELALIDFELATGTTTDTSTEGTEPAVQGNP